MSKIKESELKAGMIIHHTDPTVNRCVILLERFKQNDVYYFRCMNLLDHSGVEADRADFHLPVSAIVKSGELITITQLASLMYQYHVSSHLDLAKKACDKADAPRFRYSDVATLKKDFMRWPPEDIIDGWLTKYFNTEDKGDVLIPLALDALIGKNEDRFYQMLFECQKPLR